MPTKINRRDFLTVVFGTAAAAIIGSLRNAAVAAVPAAPICPPATLTLSSGGYIVDADFNYWAALPTRREYYDLIGLDPDTLKNRLTDLYDQFESEVNGRDDWTVDDLTFWLDDCVEFDDMSPREAMNYTEYGPALKLYDQLPRKVADELGLKLIEGEHPGHDFVGVRYRSDIKSLNEGLRRHGINLVIIEE